MTKNAEELVRNQKSLGFFSQLFLVPKQNNWLGPILELSNLNQFLKAEKFKMKTPETIRTPQTGHWVTSKTPTFKYPFKTSPGNICVFTSRVKCTILLRYNSVPCGTQCYLGWPQALANVQEKWLQILADALLQGRGDPDSDVCTSFFLLATILLGSI